MNTKQRVRLTRCFFRVYILGGGNENDVFIPHEIVVHEQKSG